METAPEIVFEGMDPSEFITERIDDELDKLEEFHHRITACRVVVEAPHRHKHKGKLYNVRIHLTIPKKGEVAVGRNPASHHAHEDVYVAIRDAFKAARRQLQDKTRRRQEKVKQHEVPPLGRVAKLIAEADYGFIETLDGREIYFHANSLVNIAFDRLRVGTEVRFAEEMGDDGPQASSVRLTGKHDTD